MSDEEVALELRLTTMVVTKYRQHIREVCIWDVARREEKRTKSDDDMDENRWFEMVWRAHQFFVIGDDSI